MLRHARLHEQCRHARIESGGEPVDRHFADRLRYAGRVFVAGGERMPVRYEEIALVLILQLYPVAQRAVVVTQM